jgi:DNA-binding CsgD family transcriptional regulator
MNLTHKQAALVFSIMRDLTGEFSHSEVRRRVGQSLLELLDADYFASYIWDAEKGAYESRVQINMTPENLLRYECYFQFHDPITPILQRRRRATAVSQIMRHDRLIRTEFYNDFLKLDGLCFGLNYFAYDRGENIGDVRIWRSARKEDFSERDALLIDAIGPSFVNALSRARRNAMAMGSLRFAQIGGDLGFTRREAEVADLLAVGLSDGEICDRLGCSKSTLRTHVATIFRKSGRRRRAQLAPLLVAKNHHL